MSQFLYPNTRRDDTKEVIHGIEVRDPYRWLEDPDSEDTKRFIDSQNAVSMSYIESCVYRKKIKDRLTQLWNHCRYECPFKRGDKYFYRMNTGLQNQSVLYIMDSLDSTPRVFLDPNLLSEDGTTSLIVYPSFSEDGQWLCYGLSDSGSDWIRIRIRNVNTGEDCPEELTKIKFSVISWTHDNKGFFYSCYSDLKEKSDGIETKANSHNKLYYHRINTEQIEDILVVQFKDKPNYEFEQFVSDCGKYLHIHIYEGFNDILWYYTSLDGIAINSELKITPIIEEFSAQYDYVTNDGDICYILTNKNAPNFRLIQIDLKSPAIDNWIDLIPEHPKDVLKWCKVANNDFLISCYLRDVINVLELRKLSDGSLVRQLDIPIGSITGFSGNRKQNEIFYSFQSFLSPGIIYHFDFISEPKVFKEITVQDFDPSLYITKQVFYESKDGTKIPLFVVHHKDIVLNGDNLCLLYGYGGSNISVQPSFNNSRIFLMKNLNGIFALANIRGGGEYGKKWHDSGKLLHKQNCFDDFHSAAQYLIDNRYTNSNKLIIEGASNGGLLVGAAANQRPDLFGCVICRVGVLDMLRLKKFTIGPLSLPEYGDPDQEQYFKYMLKYSPLHNIPNSCHRFPATLVLTGDHDDRVVPSHSFKFISELQHKLGETNPNTPLMVRIEKNAGHGAGKPTAKVIEEYTDIYSFIINALRIKYIE